MTQKIARPARTVGLWGASLFPLNGMIGAGIFALPAVLVAAMGSFAPWVMLLGGLFFLPLVLCYAWLATRFEHSGGPVLYGEAAFGRFVGFQAGWGRYASAIVTAAANTHVMVAYLAAIFPVLKDPDLAGWLVAGILLLTMIINLIGMRVAVGALGIMTAIKLAPLFALVVAALAAGTEQVGFALPEFSDGEAILLLTYYAFMGFESVTEAAGEFRDPERNLPRALVGTVSAVTLLYMAIIWAYLAIGPGMGGEDNALAGSARAVMGELGAVVIVIAASVSIAANNFAGGTTLPRLSFGMAERGMLPRWFLGVSKRFGTPTNAILFGGIAGIAFGLWEGFAVLAIAGTLVRLVTYVISAAALPVIERREGAMKPWHLAASIFAVVSTIWVASHADLKSFYAFIGLMALGTLLYFIAAREKPLQPAPE